MKKTNEVSYINLIQWTRVTIIIQQNAMYNGLLGMTDVVLTVISGINWKVLYL